MARKMTLSGYLAQRGTKAKALTRGEAALLGIPYPLQAGWPRRYGAVEIAEEMLQQLVACAEAARRAADEKAQRAMHQDRRTPASAQQLILAPSVQTSVRMISGFTLRQARRYRKRHAAPWA